MWVAQITDPADQGQEDDQLAALVRRFPDYHFSVMLGEESFVIAKPRQHGDNPDDEELDILRFIVTSLIDELITGHMITDR